MKDFWLELFVIIIAAITLMSIGYVAGRLDEAARQGAPLFQQR